MMRSCSRFVMIVAAVFLLGPVATALPSFPGLPGFPSVSAPAPKLESLKANVNATTASGVSSGAYMALQLVISSSERFHGAGLIAGGPWHCAEGSSQTAQDRCMKNPDKIDVASLVAQTRDAAAKGKLDDIKSLALARFFVFGSEKDTVVKTPTALRLKEYLAAFVSASQIQLETSIPSAHGWPTENFGNACGQMGLPWMNKCGFDSAGAIFKQLFGKVKAKSASVTTSLKTFDQSEFDANGKATLGQIGYVYVPSACATNGNCRVHVALHGCQMSSDFVQDKFAVNSGLNEWAESNEVIVLYPQAKSSGGNPYGCWDWFGYTGPDYDTKDGAQIKAIKAMVDRLSAP